MNLYKFLEDKNKLQIIKNTSNTNKNIEIITDSDPFEELFLTKQEKKNNNTYDLISHITLITITITVFTISLFREEDIRNIQDCLVFLICAILTFSIIPILFFSYKKFFTNIGKIRLIFSANGIEIIPETSAKKTIFIEYFNISGINLKENRIKGKQNTLILMLTLYTPIKNSVTNEDIRELILIENIPNDYLEEATKFKEEIKQTLGLSM